MLTLLQHRMALETFMESFLNDSIKVSRANIFSSRSSYPFSFLYIVVEKRASDQPRATRALISRFFSFSPHPVLPSPLYPGAFPCRSRWFLLWSRLSKDVFEASKMLGDSLMGLASAQMFLVVQCISLLEQ